jgi:predicted thioredoxin/glutaredoxin
MSVSEIKEQLHKAIDEIENEELLQAMLTILAQSVVQKEGYVLTDDQLSILQEREEKYLKGESGNETLEEFKMKMNKNVSSFFLHTGL